MSPQQLLAWLDDDIAWFEDLPVGDFDLMIPSCPGWRIEDVINHLSFGLGLCYPVALSKAPEIPESDAFVGVEWPDENPTGRAALTTFSRNMRRCLATFAAIAPDTPCWTYAGPGAAKFWFRRAAIETALHRIDVEEARPNIHSPLSRDRTIDAIAETSTQRPSECSRRSRSRSRLAILHRAGIRWQVAHNTRHDSRTR